MADKEEQITYFAISGVQLAALQEFISTLNLSWKTVNPVMQLLLHLPEINIDSKAQEGKPPKE